MSYDDFKKQKEKEERAQMIKEAKGLATIIGAVIIGAVILWFSVPFYIVQPGITSIHMRLGKVVHAHDKSGIYFKYPIIDSIIYINNKIRKKTIETTALSKDLQSVSVGIAINYRVTDPVSLYRTVGIEFPKIILFPYAQESIKAGIAKYTAEDLIQYRHEVKEKVLVDLKARLEPLHINLIDINFVHSDFSRDFIAAVEHKQIAEQESKRSKNLSEKIKEEANQSRVKADAEAYALKIKRDMATPEILQLKAIEKWDGKLPQVSSGTIPFLNLNIK